MLEILYIIGITLGLFYSLWILYLAVMNLKRVKNLGKLHPAAFYLGVPVFAVGITLDVLLNIFVMTVILLELPKELTITARLQRHNKTDGWRKYIAKILEPILDPFDPSGDHI
jgi:hypothetical protein